MITTYDNLTITPILWMEILAKVYLALFSFPIFSCDFTRIWKKPKTWASLQEATVGRMQAKLLRKGRLPGTGGEKNVNY